MAGLGNGDAPDNKELTPTCWLRNGDETARRRSATKPAAMVGMRTRDQAMVHRAASGDHILAMVPKKEPECQLAKVKVESRKLAMRAYASGRTERPRMIKRLARSLKRTSHESHAQVSQAGNSCKVAKSRNTVRPAHQGKQAIHDVGHSSDM